VTLTEAEAKTKWCPFARVALFPRDQAFGPAWNRLRTDDAQSTYPSEARCIASACMAWRWVGTKSHKSANGHGYCGLAVAP
jgi:hypothetical protein